MRATWQPMRTPCASAAAFWRMAAATRTGLPRSRTPWPVTAWPWRPRVPIRSIASTPPRGSASAPSRGRAPLLLLDEIAAHLDAERRAALFDEVVALGVQSWMTGTDAGLFAPLGGRAQILRVADGSIAAV